MRDNINEVYFRGGSKARAPAVYQYDYGQWLTFPDLELPTAYEVHFSASITEASVTVIGGEDGVEIPDTCLLRAGTLNAYIYLHTGDSDGETVYIVKIPVKERPPIGEEEPESVQQGVITQAIAALNSAVERTETNLSGYALKEDTVLTTTLSRGRKSGEAVGDGSFAFGFRVIASGEYSHAEGSSTNASGGSAHAEGGMTRATQMCAHAEGNQTFARGVSAHSEGLATYADGNAAHVEGMGGKAVGNNSHAEGLATIANGKSQHVVGEYNAADVDPATPTDRSPYVEIVGNGTANNKRSNARTLDWSGNAWFAGKVSTGTPAAPGAVTANNDLTTKQYVDNGDATIKAITDYNIMMGNLEDPGEGGEDDG